ncbi:hypothetical protein SDC9_128634 [bioreactor metagenome]|uniref:Uncharacterized protein n=1 Tax=bioreactor metagenome TaxID=1076179 RepID=A0A645CWN9_9ZZZZ
MGHDGFSNEEMKGVRRGTAQATRENARSGLGFDDPPFRFGQRSAADGVDVDQIGGGRPSGCWAVGAHVALAPPAASADGAAGILGW